MNVYEKCPDCGLNIPPDSKVCPYCGKKFEEDIFDSFCYQCLDRVFSDKNTSSHIDNIDYLVDRALAQHSGRRKVSSIIKKKLLVKEILAIALTLSVVLAAIPYILPPLYGDFGSDVSVSIGPENVRDGDSLFVNVTIPSSYRIRSVTADMAGIETINLSLVDNSTLLHLWQAVWVVHDVVPGEHIVTISALDVDNVSYYAGVRWSVLPEETPDDNQSSESGANDTVPPADVDDINKSSNETLVSTGLNLTLQSDKGIYIVDETVLIEGIVSYNNLLVNVSVSLLIDGPGYNLSVGLNASDGRFYHQFIPTDIGNYIVQASVSYENETVIEEIDFYVQGLPLNITLEVSELYIWDDTDYQLKYVDDLITFFANYSSFNQSIENATCIISFNVGTWTEPATMSYSDGIYVYNRSFDTDGTYEYRVWCSALGFENKTMVSECFIYENVSVVSIMDVKKDERVYALPGTRFYVERTVDGLNGTDAVFAPLFSDALTIEKFEILRDGDTMGQGLETSKAGSPRAFTAGNAVSDIERKIDGLREGLPIDVKQLNRVSYSELFSLNRAVTVRVWFKAPSWEEIRSGSKPSSGKISYLVFSNDSDDFDYESSTWWDSNWGYRKLITVNSSQIATNLVNFPILVNITDTDLRDDAQDDGDDIAFVLYSDNSTQLNHEIELFNDTTGELIAWVNVTSLSSIVDTKIWMYYNNSATSNQQNPTGVWDDDYWVVWHLNESSSPSQDSTAYNNDGTWGAGKTAEDSVDAKISKGTDFDGVNTDTISGSVGLSATKTISFWYNRDDTVGNWDTLFEGNPDNDEPFLGFGDGGDINDIEIWYNGGQRWNSAAKSLDTWYYFVFISDGSNSRIYIDGTDESGALANYAGTPTSFMLGWDDDSPFHGIMDEFRISNISRSADWINTCYNNQKNQSTFISVASEQILINTSVNTISPYNVTYSPYTITATNNTPVDNVTLWYRYSSDNNSWDSWLENNTDTSSPWQWSFSFLNGTGYYEFYSIGKKSGSPDETPPGSADAMCHWIENTSIEVTPSQWDVGTTTIGDYNYSTSGYYFNLTNEGNLALNIQIKASNATNATTGARWNLTSTPGHNNFSLQNNKSGGSWTYINTTYDVFVTNLGVDSWQTFDLNLIMATTSSKGDPLSLTVTFRSVAS